MFSLLQFFYAMSLMRISPERVPSSPILVGLLLGSNLLVQVIYFKLNPSVKMTVVLAAGWVVVIIASSSLMLFGLLRAADYQERFAKTFAALQGCDLMLTLPRILLLLINVALVSNGPFAGLVMFLGTLIQLYSLVVFGFILQHAFGVRKLSGVGIALLLAVLSALCAAMLLPLPELTDPELVKRLSEGGFLQPK